MRVLLVEDGAALAQGIRMALRGEGYTLDWVADGLAAERFDLVLLDLGLPRLDLLRRLRSQPDGRVLVLTFRDAKADRIQGLDAGADDYLVRPCDLDRLKARLRALIRRSCGRAQPLLEHASISLDPASQAVRYRGAEEGLLQASTPAAASWPELTRVFDRAMQPGPRPPTRIS